MHPSSGKNEKLVRQFPFLAEIVSMPIEPLYEGMPRTALDDLTIKVERADGDLLFRQADNAGFGDGDFRWGEGSRAGLIGRRQECVFAVGHDNKLLNVMYWPRNDTKKRAAGSERYARSVLWVDEDTDGLRGQNRIHDRVQCLVWVTVETWHQDAVLNHASNGRFGIIQARTMAVTVYKKPPVGFQGLDESSGFEDHFRLTGRRIQCAGRRNDSDILAMGSRVGELCHRFWEDVYSDGLKDAVDRTHDRMLTGMFGTVQVECVTFIGGEPGVDIRDSKSWLRLALLPGGRGMYASSLDGTLPQLRNLVRTVARAWREDPAARENFLSGAGA